MDIVTGSVALTVNGQDGVACVEPATTPEEAQRVAEAFRRARRDRSRMPNLAE